MMILDTNMGKHAAKALHISNSSLATFPLCSVSCLLIRVGKMSDFAQ